MNPKVSIIIVNWNTKDLTLQCLDSLFKNIKEISYEVYVVDNASNDGSPEAIKTKFPQVNLIINKENKGFACANNQVIPIAKGDCILFLNSDTVVLPTSIEKIYEFLRLTPRAGAANCELVDEKGKRQFSARRFPTIKLALKRYFSVDRQAYDYKADSGPFEVEALSGACLMVKSEVLKKIGLFDENFFMYSEDVDLSYRIRKAGWSNYFIPKVKIIHFGSRSLGTNYYSSISQFSYHPLHYANYLFYRKYHNFFLSLLYWIIYKIGIIYLRIYGRIIDFRDYFYKKTGIWITRKGIKLKNRKTI